MGDNLYELNRKQLKELCSQNNIRTAGVKHEDLVRLLHNKLYPSLPQMPRAMKGRGPKEPNIGKEDGDSYKTPIKPAGRGRNFRSSTLSREDVTTSARKSMTGLPRKPLLAKSNTMSSQRTDLGMKTLGVDHNVQENFVRRLCQINGMSPLSRKGMEATSRKTTSKPIHLSLAHANGKIEELTSPRPSEGRSDAGSDASRRVSEIATDAGPDTMSDLSDAEEFRSISSEPISKLSSISKRNNSLRTELSKMSHLSTPSGFSLLAAGTSWGTNDHTKDNLSRANSTEDIFPEFPLEGSNFLVGNTDALDMSFLQTGDADPEVIVKGKDEKFDVMDSPIPRNYVNYKCGSKADIKENSIDSNRVSIGEEPRDVNSDLAQTSIDAKDKPKDSIATILVGDTESKEVGHINDEVELPKNELALGNEGSESRQYEPHKEDVEDGLEIHSELPCLELNSPTFDLKDYNVAKKLVFEREENMSLPPPMLEGKEVNAPSSEEGCVHSVLEKEDPASLSKSDEPTEAVSETLLLSIENTSSDGGEGVNGNNLEEGSVLFVPKTLDKKDSKSDEPTMNSEVLSETPPPTIENSSFDRGEEINVKIFEGPAFPVPKTLDEKDFTLHSKSDEPKLNVEAVSETLLPTIENSSFDGREEVNIEERHVLSVAEEEDCALHSKSDEPTINAEAVSETTPPMIENSSSDGGEEVNIEGLLLSVVEEEDYALHSKSDEPTINAEAVSETPPPTIENTSFDGGEEVNIEERLVLSMAEEEDRALHSKSDEPTINVEAFSETPQPTIENTSFDGGEEVNIEEKPVLSVAEEEDRALHSKSDKPTINGEAVSETPPPTIENSSYDGREEVNVEGHVLFVAEEEDHALHSKSDEPTINVEAVSETPQPTIENSSFDGGEEVNIEEGLVLSMTEEEDHTLHSKSDEPTMNAEAFSETTPPMIENSSSDGGEEVNVEGHVLFVAEEEDHALLSKSNEPTMHVEAISQTLSSMIENSSSNGRKGVNVEGLVLSVLEEEDPALHSKSDEPTMNGEAVFEALPPTIENASFDEGEEVNVEEVPVLSVPKTLDKKDFVLHSKTSELAMNDGLVETVSGSLPLNTSSDVDITSNIDGEGGVTFVKELDALTMHKDESELADTKVSSQRMDSFETEDQDTSNLEIHVDMSSDSSLTKNASNKAAPKLEGGPVNEPKGLDVKVGDGQSASTSTIVVDHNKDECEKEDKQVWLSFPLSIIVWCSQLCSRRSRNRRILVS